MRATHQGKDRFKCRSAKAGCLYLSLLDAMG